MKITHNKEHCFLAVWALQQYGGLRVADADENDDDARGVKKKHSSRGGHLPKELVLEAALKTKSHKADGWYEMYGRCKIDTTEDAVFLDLDFDYGS